MNPDDCSRPRCSVSVGGMQRSEDGYEQVGAEIQ